MFCVNEQMLEILLYHVLCKQTLSVCECFVGMLGMLSDHILCEQTSVCFVGMLEMISDHVRASVLGADSFEATHGVIVTWYRVTFAGAWCKSSSTYDRCQVSNQPHLLW